MIKRKHISFLLLLSFSVLLGHSLVPHHHHAEIVEDVIDDHCPVEHEDHHADEETPVHCHAFNDLTFYKINGEDVLQKVKNISTTAFIIADQFNEISNAFAGNTYNYIEAPPELAGVISSHTSRGPPVFA